jgi:hypothetical protein
MNHDKRSSPQRFWEKGRQFIKDQPLLANVDSILRTKLLTFGKQISKTNPQFAEFFVYEELAYLSDDMHEEFQENLKAICVELSKPEMTDLIGEISPEFRELISTDWDKAVPGYENQRLPLKKKLQRMNTEFHERKLEID